MRCLLSVDRHIPEAIGELGKPLQDDPDFYWAHVVLAIIYNYQGDSQRAVFHKQQAEAIVQRRGNAGP